MKLVIRRTFKILTTNAKNVVFLNFDFRPSTFDPRPRLLTLDFRPSTSTFDPRPMTGGPPMTLDPRPMTLDLLPSTYDPRPSTITQTQIRVFILQHFLSVNPNAKLSFEGFVHVVYVF
jgi:hypothetical protein